jgi:tetratricopeptide (TPR) repeat protein
MNSHIFRTQLATLSIALLAVLPAVTHAADVSYKEGEGWLIDLFGKGKLNPDSALKAARDHVSNKQVGKAADTYRTIIKFAPLSPQAEAARFELGTLLETLGEYDDAFDRFEEYLKKNPNGPRFENAVESMYRIAKRYMDGECSKASSSKPPTPRCPHAPNTTSAFSSNAKAADKKPS